VAQTRANEPAPYLIPLDLTGDELLAIDTSPSASGWAAYHAPGVTDQHAEVLLRIGGATREPLEVWEVRVLAGPHAGGFASSLLREIPVLRIEAAINQTIHRRHLRGHIPTDTAADPPGGQRYRTRPTRRPRPPARSVTIEDPGGYRKPDDFYRLVADAYLHLAAVSSRPAHELAEANQVPVATVHRWIREAKTRGVLLLPAHRTASGS
jgi:hypothetical protein